MTLNPFKSPPLFSLLCGYALLFLPGIPHEKWTQG
jgi:hypothetical protein